jgi:metal-sulfur cluster biosynthetic enzyme
MFYAWRDTMINTETVLKALEDVVDPELGYSVVELGLIYRVKVEGKRVEIDFTLTSFGCPLADLLTADIEAAVRSLHPAAEPVTTLVWDPPWGPERMNEEARLDLGYPV